MPFMWFRGGLQASAFVMGICDFAFSVGFPFPLHEQNLPLFRLWLRFQKEETTRKSGLI
jgi:hypothetical protein